MTLTWWWLIGAFIVGAVVGAGLVIFYCTPDDDVHVCSAPGIEMRLMVNGQAVLSGDSAGLHYSARYGQKKDGGWYDMLNSNSTSFSPRPGSKIGLEIRPTGFERKSEAHD